LRRTMIGLVALLALVGGVWSWLQRRNGGKLNRHADVQWPFDKAELRSLMDRVIAEQRDRVSAIEDIAGRNRAQAFLDYYERRRQAAAS
jgi:hypothetical protein